MKTEILIKKNNTYTRFAIHSVLYIDFSLKRRMFCGLLKISTVYCQSSFHSLPALEQVSEAAK